MCRECGVIEIVGAEVRNHFAADIAHFAVGQNAFQTVAHIDAALVIVDRQKHQHAAI